MSTFLWQITLILILNYFLLVLMSWGQQLGKNTWQIHYSPTTSKEISNSILRYFKKGTKKKIGKYNTISNTHKKVPTHDWQNLVRFFFLVSYYYIPFLLLLSKVDLTHQNEKMREFLKFTATQHTSLLLLCDFFVVSQWRSFIKWQRIFRFLVELFKGEFYNLPPLYIYWQTCLVDIS